MKTSTRLGCFSLQFAVEPPSEINISQNKLNPSISSSLKHRGADNSLTSSRWVHSNAFSAQDTHSSDSQTYHYKELSVVLLYGLHLLTVLVYPVSFLKRQEPLRVSHLRPVKGKQKNTNCDSFLIPHSAAACLQPIQSMFCIRAEFNSHCVALPFLQGIEQLKKEERRWAKKSKWMNMKVVFGHPFSIAWLSPFATPDHGKADVYQYIV